MVETRIAPRFKVDKRAIANYGGDKYPCTVRDLSATGAALEFPDPVNIIPIAKAFTLIIPDDGLKLPCRIVWKSGHRMGVSFD
jgi:hypothetical protein